MSRHRVVRPGVYTPYGAAQALWECQEKEVLIEGPAGTGKTRAVLEKAHLFALKHPGARALLCRKTRESMTESVLVTFEQEVVPAGSAILTPIQRRNRQSYAYPNGSHIVVAGLDKPEKIMSAEYQMICVFEATEAHEADWEKLASRLRSGDTPYRQIIADCNPAYPSHWLNQRAITGHMSRFRSRHKDNPVLYNDGDWTPGGSDYMETLKRLSGPRFLRLFKGLWTAAEGLVYEEWDPAVHIIPRFTVPPHWRKFRVVDFGFTNPFVCKWYALDEDGRLYVYRELYKTRTLVEDHAINILALSGQERLETTVCDHDAEGRATLERHRIATVPAIKSIQPGIQEVQARLRIADDGRPRLYYLEDSLVARDPLLVKARAPVCSTEEFESYVWPLYRDGRPIKEDPVKLNDHGVDCDRYACMYLAVNRRYQAPTVPANTRAMPPPQLRIPHTNKLLL